MVKLVPASSYADQYSFLNETRDVFSVDFPGEVMRRSVAFREVRELLGEREFF